MFNKRILAVSGIVFLSACTTAGPLLDKVKLYDAVVFEVTHTNALAPIGMQDVAEFSKSIAERLLPRSGIKLQERKGNDLTLAATCGPRTMKIVSDISGISVLQKGKVSLWNPFSATSEQVQKVKISIEGTVVDCVTGKTLQRFSVSSESGDNNSIVNNLAYKLASIATKAQWSK